MGWSWAEPQWMYLLAPAVLATLFAIRPWRAPASRRIPAAILIAAGTALALAAISAPHRTKTQSEPRRWVLLVDASASLTPEDARRQARFVQDLTAQPPPDTEIRIVRFGADGPPATFDTRERTRLTPALIAARGADRAVLLSDGLFAEPREALLAIARQAGVPLDLPAHLPAPRRLLVARSLTLAEPPGSQRGARADLEYESTFDGEAELSAVLQRAGDAARDLGRRKLSVMPGRRALPIKLPELEPGIYRLRATLSSTLAPHPAHQMRSLLIEVGESPRTLLVSDQPGGGTIAAMLERSRHRVDVKTAAQLPGDARGLAAYQEVILAGVPLASIRREASWALTRWVRHGGGGLLFLDGCRPLRSAAWAASPLAELFPVTPSSEPENPDKDEPPRRDPIKPIKPNKRKPALLAKPVLAVVLLIDKSGSMDGKKLALAKEAAKACLETLHEKDLLGIVAFDSRATWAVTPTEVRFKFRIEEHIDRLSAGGETDISRALKTAAARLQPMDCPVKHVILLSDGHTGTGTFQKLVQGMTRHNITLSTIGIGRDFDQTLMPKLAQWGKGKFTYTYKPEEIPQFVHAETRRALKRAARHRPENQPPDKRDPDRPPRKPIKPDREPAKPRKDAGPPDRYPVQALLRAPFMNGLTMRFPDLGDIARTQARPGATVLLETTRERLPVLTAWRHGIGRVGLFAGAFTGKAAGSWDGWAQLPRFTAQLASYMLAERPTAGPDIEAELVWRGRRFVQLDVQARRADGSPFDGTITVVDAMTGAPTDAPRQVAPGRFRLVAPSADPAPVWRVTAGESERLVTAELPHPTLRPNPALLGALSSATGGATGVRPATLYARPDARKITQPAGAGLLLSLTAVLYSLGVAVWRVARPRLPAA